MGLDGFRLGVTPVSTLSYSAIISERSQGGWHPPVSLKGVQPKFQVQGMSFWYGSAQALYDFFPFAGGFHLSPGLMIYNGNQLTATAAVPGGQTFTLGGVNYMSDRTSPVSGNGKLQFSKAGPMFLVGFGNLAKRSERHFGMTFDIGAVYQGTPRTSLSFAGRACDSIGFNCTDVATDPTFQSNVVSEQVKINHSLSPLRFFPVVSVGFGYKF